ncbi:unnamed protein product [Cyprideis torosa]|uniref:Uncharacterized protein n=1 Tax=Cyprideis torosa TaxID=163714 RepID=A0A7R8WNM1_9CRUS|nr:unnamed protein product [Cyprideis torosa]CAG0900566.1 unnamed protein product [Cyprideis torosa]
MVAMKYTCALLAVLALIGTPSHGSTLPRHNVTLERQEQNVNVLEILKNLLTRLTKIGIDSALSMVGFDLNQVKELKENWDLALKVMRTVLEKTKELLASLKEYRDCMQAQGREFNEERMDNAIRAYESLLSVRTEVENDRFILAGLLTIYSTYKSIKTTYQATVEVVAALVEVYQAVEPLLDELFPEQMNQGLLAETWEGLLAETWEGLLAETWEGLLAETWEGLLADSLDEVGAKVTQSQ